MQIQNIFQIEHEFYDEKHENLLGMLIQIIFQG